MEETELYSGELDPEVCNTLDEAVDGPIHSWQDADVDVILEENGDYELRIEGAETRSILVPWRTHKPTATYDLDEGGAEYLEQEFLE